MTYEWNSRRVESGKGGVGKGVLTRGTAYVKADLGVPEAWTDQSGWSTEQGGGAGETGIRALWAVLRS